mmetsp:Transcript_40607/g.91591  ORF Transcript_40607/g.91591 Transcript_40607/m.91591 type:complete len:223 (-) Transcript_40607:7-675(-)
MPVVPGDGLHDLLFEKARGLGLVGLPGAPCVLAGLATQLAHSPDDPPGRVVDCLLRFAQALEDAQCVAQGHGGEGAFHFIEADLLCEPSVLVVPEQGPLHLGVKVRLRRCRRCWHCELHVLHGRLLDVGSWIPDSAALVLKAFEDGERLAWGDGLQTYLGIVVVDGGAQATVLVVPIDGALDLVESTNAIPRAPATLSAPSQHHGARPGRVTTLPLSLVGNA